MATYDASLNTFLGQTAAYEVYDATQRFIGTASVTLPELTFLSTEISGAGIAGQVDLPSRWITGSLTMTLQWRAVNSATFHLFEQNSHDISCYGAINSYNAAGLPDEEYGTTQSTETKTFSPHNSITGNSIQSSGGVIRVMPVVIIARCLPKKLNIGKFEPNALMDSESEFELTYIRITVDGTTVLLLDKFNYTLEINGKDYAGDVASAVGMGVS